MVKILETKYVASGQIGTTYEGIILIGNDTNGRLFGIRVRLEVVDDRRASIEADNGIAGCGIFDGASEVESVAPNGFVDGVAARKQSFVVMQEAVAHIGVDSPIAERAAELETDKGFLNRTVVAR